MSATGRRGSALVRTGSTLEPRLSSSSGFMAADAIAEAGATSKKQMGAVMKLVQQKAAGRADNKTLSTLVQKFLA